MALCVVIFDLFADEPAAEWGEEKVFIMISSFAWFFFSLIFNFAPKIKVTLLRAVLHRQEVKEFNNIT